MTLRKKHRDGFSLIEGMAAIFILSMVAVVVSNLVHKNMVSGLWTGYMKKAAALADQVFEKYDYLASVHFATLESYEQTHVAPATFFASGSNNLGYDQMWITTEVGAITSNGTRKLDVSISWGDEGPGKSLIFSKYLSENNGVEGGAPVHIYVVDDSGQGIGGFEVRAEHHYDPNYRNTFGTNEVIGYTDTAGFVTLLNVSVDPNLQPIAIKVRKVGSATHILKADTTNYSPGYYAPGSQTWASKSLTVTQVTANVMHFSQAEGDFFPCGSMEGVLSNSVDSVVDGMELALYGIASDGTHLVLSTHTQTTALGASGVYEFNNLAPGAMKLHVNGRMGSLPSIPTGHVNYVKGYAGTNGNGNRPWIYLETMPSPAVALGPASVQIVPLGTLDLTVKNFAGTSVLPNAEVTVTPTYHFPDWGYPMQVTADGTGKVVLNNVFAGDGETIHYTATVPATSCGNLGHYLYNYPLSASANTTNTQTLLLKDGVQVSGQITVASAPGTPLVANLYVNGLVPGTTVMASSNASGNFTFCGLSDEVSSVFPTWPTLPLTVEVPGQWIAASFSGQVTELTGGYALTGRRVVMASQMPAGGYIHSVPSNCASDPNPTNTTSDVITSNGSGFYGPLCAYFPLRQTLNAAVSGSVGSYTVGSLGISTTTMQAGLEIQQTANWYHPGTFLSVTNQSNYSLNFQPQIIRQDIIGTVREWGSLQPLQGVSIQYPCVCTNNVCSTDPTCSVVTNASGQYVAINVNVVGRSAGNPGTAMIQVADGASATNSGSLYKGQNITVNLDSPAYPAIDKTQDIFLQPHTGGL